MRHVCVAETRQIELDETSLQPAIFLANRNQQAAVDYLERRNNALSPLDQYVHMVDNHPEQSTIDGSGSSFIAVLFKSGDGFSTNDMK